MWRLMVECYPWTRTARWSALCGLVEAMMGDRGEKKNVWQYRPSASWGTRSSVRRDEKKWDSNILYRHGGGFRPMHRSAGGGVKSLASA